jgi:hypothetical protein
LAVSPFAFGGFPIAQLALVKKKAAANCANEHESKNYKYDSR